MSDDTPNDDDAKEVEINEFDTELDEWHFTMRTAGVPTPHVLVQLDGDGRDDYLNELTSRTKTDKEGNAVIKNFKGLHTMLLKRTVRRVDPGTKEQHVVADTTIQKWPAKVQASLFAKSQKMNGLGDETKEREKAKND